MLVIKKIIGQSLPIFGIVILLFFSSCSKKKGCTDSSALNYDSAAEINDNSCLYSVNLNKYDIKFNFKLAFNHQSIEYPDDFAKVNYQNENQDSLSITRMRYLVSKIIFNKKNGGVDTVMKGHHFVDMSDTSTYTSKGNVFEETYKSITLTFGLDSNDNWKNYKDLNDVTFNWPDMLGGGYHFMQMEGLYKIKGNSMYNNYALHMGTARKSLGVFEANHFTVTIPFNGELKIANNYSIEIIMDIAEWYKNPYTWDFKVYNTPLMPNYDAQKKMNDNGKSIFKIGKTITL